MVFSGGTIRSKSRLFARAFFALYCNRAAKTILLIPTNFLPTMPHATRFSKAGDFNLGDLFLKAKNTRLDGETIKDHREFDFS